MSAEDTDPGGPVLPSETDEWLAELAEQWVEIYKRSMTTLVLLEIVGDTAPAAAGEIQPEFVGRTGWSITERGLYRTLRRLASDGLLEVVEVR
ncbi:MAG: hypothetical protein ACK5O2_06380, partial [Microthrixaceae bacterium]